MSPEGKRLGIFDDLPLPGEHWVARRKARVVTAVLGGEISFDDACALYQLSNDEFRGWLVAYEKYGLPGLRCTRVQVYRDLRTQGMLPPTIE